MASRILLRLIDEAVIPAGIVAVTKVLSVVFLINWLHLNWHFTAQSLIPGIVFDDPEVGVFVNSYSNLLLYLVILVALVWVLIKAYHFHDTHVSPSFILQLLSLNLTSLLGTSDEIYHQALVWVSYLWLVTLLVGFHAFLGVSFLWVFIFCFVCSLIVTWVLVADVEKEFGKA